MSISLNKKYKIRRDNRTPGPEALIGGPIKNAIRYLTYVLLMGEGVTVSQTTVFTAISKSLRVNENALLTYQDYDRATR